jgi:hypothetical protein
MGKNKERDSFGLSLFFHPPAKLSSSKIEIKMCGCGSLDECLKGRKDLFFLLSFSGNIFVSTIVVAK